MSLRQCLKTAGAAALNKAGEAFAFVAGVLLVIALAWAFLRWAS